MGSAALDLRAAVAVLFREDKADLGVSAVDFYAKSVVFCVGGTVF